LTDVELFFDTVTSLHFSTRFSTLHSFFSTSSRNKQLLLVLRVQSGRDLIACNADQSSSDPYTRMIMGVEHHQTTTCTRTCDPVWEKCTHVFGLEQDLSLLIDRNNAIQVLLRVHDEDFSGKGRDMGHVVLNIDLVHELNVVAEGWHGLNR
tara:strand:- start:200 stop:652 length:453 start_codon:yes stop_codon:yes gene_type:complete